jgi:virulence-associated protein VagC
MSIQTVFKAGNSHVVAIPKEFDIKTGEKVELRKSSDGDSVVITKVKKEKKKATKTEVEHEKWLKIFMEENGEILDELALR